MRWPSLSKHRTLRVLLRSVGVFVAAALGWAFLWPDTTCSDPACARKRFAVFVEMDTLARAGDVPLDVRADRKRVSIGSILSKAGIDVTVERDQTDLPYDPASGRLDRADLYQLFQRWNQLPKPEGADAKVYALLTTALVADTGENVFGIMFDYADRQAFAVAPSATRARFEVHHPDLIPALQLRTFTHELLHALNRHHLDAAQTEEGLLTLEAPTKCIADTSERDWTLTQAISWDVSPSTIRFFQSAPPEEVLPGRSSVPFRFAQVSPRECEQARRNVVADPADSRWELARNRLQRLFWFQAAQAAQISAPIPSAHIELQVQAQSAAYPLGYPIAIRIIAANRGELALPLRGRLAPSFGLVRVETRREDSDEWSTFHPTTRFEPADDDEAMLPPGESTEQTAAVYFGEEGWTFPVAGKYELRARFSFGDQGDEVTSSPISVEIAAPTTRRDRDALSVLVNEAGALDVEIGRLFAFGGRIGSQASIEPIERLVANYRDTALGSAAALALASHVLRPPLDVDTGRRAPADVARARELLAETCTDSGVSALNRELRQRHREMLEADGAISVPTSEFAAWDGVGRKPTRRIGTYADGDLRLVGPRIHFCFAESGLADEPLAATRRLASLLKRARAQRIVIVGHTDSPSTCRFNDSLALRRAEAVRNELAAVGIRRESMEVVSLGERRPLSFATSAAANALDRRVEVLVPERVLDAEPRLLPDDDAPILPSCYEYIWID